MSGHVAQILYKNTRARGSFIPKSRTNQTRDPWPIASFVSRNCFHANSGKRHEKFPRTWHPANLSSPSVTQVPKLIRGWKNARIEGLVTRACSHASLSLELGLNVVIFWEAWKRSCDVLTFTSIWDITVSINQCRLDQETYQSYNYSL